ncbi:MAG: small ribosomal subunit Rsm22 family protein [Oscillospiraceae bacterium]
MEFPVTLKNQIEARLSGMPLKKLADMTAQLSGRYRTESGAGKRIVTDETQAAIYAAVRMPATFGAVAAALLYAIEAAGSFAPHTLLDAGAGTGAATWAAAELLTLSRADCLEREPVMRKLGAALTQHHPAITDVHWIDADLTDGALALPQAELVIASYALGELAEAARERAVLRLWEAASGMLLLVEPGTPEGFRQLRAARELLLRQGAHIAAPCPHSASCPMGEGDWCHFTCRVARSRLHKQLKGGDAPFEDEKFTYLAATKFPCEPAKARVLRHPLTEKGLVSLTLCRTVGISAESIRKSHPAYKQARKLSCGDAAQF